MAASGPNHNSSVSTPKQEKSNNDLQFDRTDSSQSESIRKNDTFVTTVSDSSDEDGEKFKKNPFLDPDVAAHWATIYEKSGYECRHVFDPTLTWTEEEEKKLVRRLDWRVCFWAVSPFSTLFFALQF